MLPMVSTSSKEGMCYVLDHPQAPTPAPQALILGRKETSLHQVAALDQYTSCLYIVDSGGASVMKTEQLGDPRRLRRLRTPSCHLPRDQQHDPLKHPEDWEAAVGL